MFHRVHVESVLYSLASTLVHAHVAWSLRQILFFNALRHGSEEPLELQGIALKQAFRMKEHDASAQNSEGKVQFASSHEKYLPWSSESKPAAFGW
jgi:hypothetical protein